MCGVVFVKIITIKMNTQYKKDVFTIDMVTEHPVMKQILADSFGGVMYNVANRDKYNTDELLATWEALTPAEKENANGLITGAINFITEK